MARADDDADEPDRGTHLVAWWVGVASGIFSVLVIAGILRDGA